MCVLMWQHSESVLVKSSRHLSNNGSRLRFSHISALGISYPLLECHEMGTFRERAHSGQVAVGIACPCREQAWLHGEVLLSLQSLNLMVGHERRCDDDVRCLVTELLYQQIEWHLVLLLVQCTWWAWKFWASQTRPKLVRSGLPLFLHPEPSLSCRCFALLKPDTAGRCLTVCAGHRLGVRSLDDAPASWLT